MQNFPGGRLSFSQVSMYLNCPRQYYFRYCTEVEKVPNEQLIFGLSVHEIIASHLNGKMKGRIRKSLIAKKEERKFQTQLKEASTYRKSCGLKPLRITELKLQHEKLLQEWHNSIYPTMNPTAVEKEIVTEIGGWPVVMYIDVIDNDQLVIDWKVTKKAKSQYLANDSLQLSMYAIGTNIHRVGFGSLVRPQSNTKKWIPKVVIVKAIRQQYELSWTHEVVKNVGRLILNEEFPPCNPENFLCCQEYCDFWLSCRGQGMPVMPSWLSRM